MASFSINQTAPLDNYSGQQTTVTINQDNPAAALAASMQAPSSVPSSSDSSGGLLGSNLAIYIFIGAVIYWLFFSR